jgi:hypothetical protein
MAAWPRCRPSRDARSAWASLPGQQPETNQEKGKIQLMTSNLTKFCRHLSMSLWKCLQGINTKFSKKQLSPQKPSTRSRFCWHYCILTGKTKWPNLYLCLEPMHFVLLFLLFPRIEHLIITCGHLSSSSWMTFLLNLGVDLTISITTLE